MSRIASFLLFLLLLGCQESKPPEKPKTSGPGRHTAAFNGRIHTAMDAYYALTEAFVNWDSLSVNNKAAGLEGKLDSLEKIDSHSGSYLSHAQEDLRNLQKEQGITAKRHRFDTLSQNLFGYLQAIQYDDARLYLQYCPMAFNDADTGHWLSREADIRNPYLGLHHPTYGKGMLQCGDTKDSINFISAR